jgi:lysophospholipase L1-like esterase
MYLIPCLESHKPLDLVVILLGTNDLKMRFSVSASDIAVSAGVLVDIVQRADIFRPREADDAANPPRVLLLAPPPLGKLTEFAEMFTGGTEKSQKFSTYFRRVALEYDCAFMDTAEIIISSDIDGVHFELSEHHKLGEAVAVRVKELFGA